MKTELTKPWMNALACALIALTSWSMTARDVAAQDDTPAGAETNADEAEEGESEPPPITDPVVIALLETNPETPAELVETILILIDLKHPEAAGSLLARLVDANLDESALAMLGRRFEGSDWLKLARTAALRPAALEFSDAVLAAADQEARHPDRIAELIAASQSDDLEVWYPATVELKRAGIDGIAALVAVLADADASASHRAAVRALAAQGESVVAPLVAYADRGHAALNEQLTRVFAELPRPEARPVLLTIAFAATSSESARESALLALRRLGDRDLSADDAVDDLLKRSGRNLDRKRQFGLEAVESVEMWQWDAAMNRPKLARMSFDESSAILAGLRAQQALAIAPNSGEAAELLLTAALETSVLLGSSDQQREGIDQLAEQLGADAVEASLKKALATRRVAAAIEAIRLLGRIGDAGLLDRSAPSISPLAKATMDADREVRLAALEAVIQLAPEGGFAGASFVPAGLTYFTRALGTRQAIVADPRPGEALRVATLLGGLGYDVEMATKLGDLSRLATAQPDCELVLVAVIPSSRFTPSALERLRRDHRTATMPVAFVTAAIDLRQAEALAAGDPLAEAMIRPVNQAGLESQLATVCRPLTDGVVSAEVRRTQAARAMELLAQIADVSAGGYQLSGIIEAAVELACYDAGLNPPACALLAKLNSAQAQEQLVGLASNDALPIEMRQVAGKGFVDSVSRRGILLTNQQILVQYARYNESEHGDRATQQLLGSILDSLEGQQKTALNETP